MLNLPGRWYQAYVLDLDGTVFLGDTLLPGAARVISELRHRCVQVRYVSNNPTYDPAMVAAKLTGLGLPTPTEEIANPVVTTTDWLLANHADAVLFPIAEEPLCDALRSAGFRLSEDPAEIDIVIASYDRAFDYRKLQIAFDAIWRYRRAFLVQTNPDRYCPFPDGRGEPDCAAITAAIEACTAATCRHSFGKPDPTMLATIMAKLQVDPDQVLVVGDRLQTDIAMAKAAGVDSAVVLTGDATIEAIAELSPEQAPTWVIDRIDRLVPAAEWAGLGWTD